MKRVYLVISIVIIINTIIIPTNAFGMLALKTQQEIYNESNLVVVGTIINASGRITERITDYTLSVERYLKNDLHQGILHVTGIGKENSTLMVEDEPIFKIGDRVILYLMREGNEYKLSPYSHVLIVQKNNTDFNHASNYGTAS
jgi:hypothetical protein